MELYYKGKNIYSSVRLRECVYESRCDYKMSHLRIVFDDSNHKFDKYGFSIGDIIRVTEDNLDTKIMYINEINPVNTGYEIVAHPVQRDVLQESDSKKWKSAKFKKIMSDIANKHGLITEFYGVKDQRYKGISQNNEKDIKLASRLSILEGCILVIFDGKMIFVSNDYLKKQSGESLRIDDFDVIVKQKHIYQKCIVTNQETSGKYIGATGTGTLTFNMPLSSKSEGNRFAKNLLDYNNKDGHTVCVVNDEMKDGYSAGTVVSIKSDDHPSVSGKALIYRIRHNLINGKSKIWLRCLEG